MPFSWKKEKDCSIISETAQAALYEWGNFADKENIYGK